MSLDPRDDAPPSGLAGLAAPLLLVGLGLGLFSSAGRDDSYITYWAAEALSRFGQILNHSGDRVEQSSSLLQVLLLAVTSRVVPIDIPTLAPILSILCGAGAVVVARTLAARVAPVSASAVAWIAASATSLVYWSFSGLETSLAALLMAWFIVLTDRWLGPQGQRPRGVTMLAGTAALLLVRPEMGLVVLAAIAGLAALLTRGRMRAGSPGVVRPTRAATLARLAWPRLGSLALVAVGCAAAIVAFRLLYFGSPFPQPVSAKTHPLSREVIHAGARYFYLHALTPSGVMTWIAATWGGLVLLHRWWRDGSASIAGVLSTILVAVYVGFVVVTGGDWMELGRFITPVLPVVATLAVVGLTAALPARLVTVGAVILVASQLAGTYTASTGRSFGMPIWRALSTERRTLYPGLGFFEYANRLRDRDAPAEARLVAIVADLWAIQPRTVVVMTGQAGFVPYHVARQHFGHVRIVDRYGLSSREITRCAMNASLVRSPLGIVWPYEVYFPDAARWQACGGFPRPDVVYDLAHQDPERLALLRAEGYDIVFEQDQSPDDPRAPFPVYRDSFIAVRRDRLTTPTTR